MTRTRAGLREHAVGIAATSVLVIGMTSLAVTTQLLWPAATPDRTDPATLWAVSNRLPAHIDGRHTDPAGKTLPAPTDPTPCPQT